MVYYVYKVTNLVNGKYYIGKRSNPFPETDSYMGSGKLIKAAIKRHGKLSFKKEILAEFTNNNDAAVYEAALVTKELIESGVSYNMHEGGHGGFMHINSEPPEKRINLISLKDKVSSGQIKIGGTKNWSEKSWDKVRRQANMNRELGLCGGIVKFSEESKKKMSISHKGSKNSQYGTKWCVKTDADNLKERQQFKYIPEGWITTTEWKERKKDKTNNTYGTMWINDGNVNRLIHKNELIPTGWKRGRLMNMMVRN